jgi:hypothetical protein
MERLSLSPCGRGHAHKYERPLITKLFSSFRPKRSEEPEPRVLAESWVPAFAGTTTKILEPRCVPTLARKGRGNSALQAIALRRSSLVEILNEFGIIQSVDRLALVSIWRQSAHAFQRLRAIRLARPVLPLGRRPPGRRDRSPRLGDAQSPLRTDPGSALHHPPIDRPDDLRAGCPAPRLAVRQSAAALAGERVAGADAARPSQPLAPLPGARASSGSSTCRAWSPRARAWRISPRRRISPCNTLSTRSSSCMSPRRSTIAGSSMTACSGACGRAAPRRPPNRSDLGASIVAFFDFAQNEDEFNVPSPVYLI